jgi:phage N-6-adenine-methyltransferase
MSASQAYMPPVAATVEWGTPRDRWDRWNEERHYTLDVAASDANHLCPAYFTEAQNALVQPWRGRVWCNPPYGPAIREFVAKAHLEMLVGGGPELVDMLVPARTDVRWFHEFVWDEAASAPRSFKHATIRVQFIKGRLKFTGPEGKPLAPAPFPSMLIQWDHR